MKIRANSKKDGSALISAIIFSSILALFVIPSYLKLGFATVKQSQRSYYTTAARNLAESGLEHAIWTLQQVKENNSLWSGWTEQDGNMRTTLSGFDFGGELSAEVNVVVINLASENPEIITRARLSNPSMKPVIRYMHATLSSSGGQSLFPYGMLSREFIKASGGVVLDSWDSDPDDNPDTPFVFYNHSVRNDNIGIATTGTQDGAIEIGSSNVYGTAAVGSESKFGLDVGWGGQVGPRDPSEWDSADTSELWKKNGWKVSMQTGALATGFSAEFEEVSVPSDLNPTYDGNYELPYTKRVLYSNRWSSWYQNEYVSRETIGAPGETTVKSLNSLTIKGDAILKIEGDVILIIPPEMQKTVEVTHGGSIQLASDARLAVYVAGDVEVSGAGIFNQLQPEQFQIWGTASSNQKIDFKHNAHFSGTIYAPNADFKVSGDSAIFGAMVCNSIELTHSGSFHYDESLKSMRGTTGGDGPTSISYVHELIGEERNQFIAKLDF